MSGIEIRQLGPGFFAEVRGVGLVDKPRHMVRTTISATDADGLAEMWPRRIGA
ncbi:MAG TPA: hypothetical protein VM164_06840 [Burkholderiales bacterium]|nr:hypothetical protein [Burkholderiales bacterium]